MFLCDDITAFLGEMSSGKTLFMSMMAYYWHKFYGKTIYSNYNLTFPFKPITDDFFMDFMNPKWNLHDCILIVDELTVHMDARCSMSKKNKMYSYFILQSKKRNVKLYFTAQVFRQVDLRLRNHTYYTVFPAVYTIKNYEGKQVVARKSREDDATPYDFVVYEIMRRDGKTMKSWMFCRWAYNLFDTREIIWADDHIPKPK